MYNSRDDDNTQCNSKVSLGNMDLYELHGNRTCILHENIIFLMFLGDFMVVFLELVLRLNICSSNFFKLQSKRI